MTENMNVETFAMLVRQSEKVRADFCKDVGITLDEYYVKQNGDFEIEDMVRAFQKGFGMALIPLQSQLTEKDKQIAELEAEVKEWKDKADLWCKTANLKDHNIMINKELEKENAELKCECIRCVYSDCPRILSDYGKDRNGICAHFKDVFDENAELKDNFKIAKDNEYEYSSLLTKAKEIIKNLLILKNDHYGNTKMEWRVKVTEQAEQFISEVEK